MLDDDNGDDDDDSDAKIQDKLKGIQEDDMEDDDDDEAPESVGFATSKDKVLEQIRYLCILSDRDVTHSVRNGSCLGYRGWNL